MQNQDTVGAPASRPPAAAGPTILRLTINSFRGIDTFSWYPAAGVNVILGGGDVGKTTILDAIALLLSPTTAANLSDTDYHLRKTSDEFAIEAVMSLPQDGAINQQPKHLWPLEWNGTEPVVPSADADSIAPESPVYRLRVRGTADLELVHEILVAWLPAMILPAATAEQLLRLSLPRRRRLPRKSRSKRLDDVAESRRGSLFDASAWETARRQGRKLRAERPCTSPFDHHQEMAGPSDRRC